MKARNEMKKVYAVYCDGRLRDNLGIFRQKKKALAVAKEADGVVRSMTWELYCDWKLRCSIAFYCQSGPLSKGIKEGRENEEHARIIWENF